MARWISCLAAFLLPLAVLSVARAADRPESGDCATRPDLKASCGEYHRAIGLLGRRPLEQKDVEEAKGIRDRLRDVFGRRSLRKLDTLIKTNEAALKKKCTDEPAVQSPWRGSSEENVWFSHKALQAELGYSSNCYWDFLETNKVFEVGTKEKPKIDKFNGKLWNIMDPERRCDALGGHQGLRRVHEQARAACAKYHRAFQFLGRNPLQPKDLEEAIKIRDEVQHELAGVTLQMLNREIGSQQKIVKLRGKQVLPGTAASWTNQRIQQKLNAGNLQGAVAAGRTKFDGGTGPVGGPHRYAQRTAATGVSGSGLAPGAMMAGRLPEGRLDLQREPPAPGLKAFDPEGKGTFRSRAEAQGIHFNKDVNPETLSPALQEILLDRVTKSWSSTEDMYGKRRELWVTSTNEGCHCGSSADCYAEKKRRETQHLPKPTAIECEELSKRPPDKKNPEAGRRPPPDPHYTGHAFDLGGNLARGFTLREGELKAQQIQADLNEEAVLNRFWVKYEFESVRASFNHFHIQCDQLCSKK